MFVPKTAVNEAAIDPLEASVVLTANGHKTIPSGPNVPLHATPTVTIAVTRNKYGDAN